MARRKKYTREQLSEAVAESRSVRQVIIRLGLNESGSMYSSLKKAIKEWDIDNSHFCGKAHLKGGIPSNATPLEEILRKNTTYRSSTLKRRLIKAGKLEDECSVCGLGPIWEGRELTLELDHINGDRFDNRLENLRVICPNCHSQTPTFRGRKTT